MQLSNISLGGREEEEVVVVFVHGLHAKLFFMDFGSSLESGSICH